jgi:glycosyltransferase involved in cell wall biosynthesis
MNDEYIIAVIPALNEEGTISDVVANVLTHVDKVVVVDDGSADETASRAREAGAVVHRHETTRGYDQSIDDGFALAAKRGATVVFTFDADGQHHSEDIPKMIEPILSGEADVVVGQRPIKARISEKMFAAYTRRRLGVADPLCGFKVYRTEVYRDIGHFDTRSTIGTQLMVEAKKRRYNIQQRPVHLDEREDESRFGQQLEADWKILAAMMRLIWFDLTTTPSSK